jgi:hypothetical protein
MTASQCSLPLTHCPPTRMPQPSANSRTLNAPQQSRLMDVHVDPLSTDVPRASRNGLGDQSEEREPDRGRERVRRAPPSAISATTSTCIVFAPAWPTNGPLLAASDASSLARGE